MMPHAHDDTCGCGSVAALSSKGDALFALGRHRESLAQFEAAIALDSAAPYPWYGKGRALTKLGSYVDAADPLRRFLELSRGESKLTAQVSAWLAALTRVTDIPSVPPPTDPLEIARALRASGKPHEALERLEAARPRAEVWLERARCHEDLARPGLAREAVIEALMLDDRDPDAWALRARAESILDRRDEARRALERLLRLCPHSPGHLVIVASIFARLGDHARATRHAVEALARDPGHVEAWLIKGKSDLALGQHKAAMAALERAKRLAPPHDFRVHHEVAAAMRKLGARA